MEEVDGSERIDFLMRQSSIHSWALNLRVSRARQGWRKSSRRNSVTSVSGSLLCYIILYHIYDAYV